ncbi:MAG: hypothetical protein ACXW5U_31510 [Thermoanaerobaculia bacterium]
MPIPALNDDGLLPPGIYDCEMAEIQEQFASRKHSAMRCMLGLAEGEIMNATADAQLQLLIDQLARMYEAAAALREKLEATQPNVYRVMVEGPMEEIRRLQLQLDEYTGLAQLKESEADLWIRIEGEEIEWQSAPTSVLTAVLDAFRKGVQSIAEMIERGSLSSRPTKVLKDAADMRLVALAPGSMQLGLKLPDSAETQEGVIRDEPVRPSVVERALHEFLAAASWAAEESTEEMFSARIPDAHRRRIVMNAVKAVLPRKRGSVSLVEFHGRLLPDRAPLRLTREAHARIDVSLDSLVTEKIETHLGFLREIDLDAQTFELRKPGDPVSVRCAFGDELLPLAKEALDRQVQVMGTRSQVEGRRPSSLQVTRLEIVDEDANEGSRV